MGKNLQKTLMYLWTPPEIRDLVDFLAAQFSVTVDSYDEKIADPIKRPIVMSTFPKHADEMSIIPIPELEELEYLKIAYPTPHQLLATKCQCIQNEEKHIADIVNLIRALKFTREDVLRNFFHFYPEKKINEYMINEAFKKLGAVQDPLPRSFLEFVKKHHKPW